MNRRNVFIAAVLLFLFGLAMTMTVNGMSAVATNPSAEVYKKVEALSEQYKQNLLVLVLHKPAVIQAESDNAKIGTEIKGLMDFQPDQNQK